MIDGIPSFLPATGDLEAFDPEFFNLLEKAEEHHFWFIARREIILETLRRHVSGLAGKKMLEIGCGNGNILRYLGERTELQLTGGDLFMEGLKFCRRQVGIPLYQIDATALPFRDCFDIIGIFDVLEHIEDDDSVLRECHKALRAQGRLILTVPACPALWGPFDEFSHHQRRYTRRELHDKLRRAGFAIERAPHFMFFLFPLVYALRTLTKRFGRAKVNTADELPDDLRVVPILNPLSLRLLRLEKLLMRYFDLPYGTSLLVVARRL